MDIRTEAIYRVLAGSRFDKRKLAETICADVKREFGLVITRRLVSEVSRRSFINPTVYRPPILGLKGGGGFFLALSPEDLPAKIREFEATVDSEKERIRGMKRYYRELLKHTQGEMIL